ncbi:membrane-associated protein, putative [Bodo saltans]|uniref:Membrane-associated protein, putative n=1 Tax=Bodo saltans TaxID=75058 RepID=A0A0S4KLU6_BODSA|nr:membrane-associated protein, putative [Bodo saltans]|eukprot:CUI14591.1 membrane-associated protein, putative [Bodo saltans]
MSTFRQSASYHSSPPLPVAGGTRGRSCPTSFPRIKRRTIAILLAMIAALLLWLFLSSDGVFIDGGTSAASPFLPSPSRQEVEQKSDVENMRKAIAQVNDEHALKLDCSVDPCGWWLDPRFFPNNAVDTEHFEPLLADEYEMNTDKGTTLHLKNRHCRRRSPTCIGAVVVVVVVVVEGITSRVRKKSVTSLSIILAVPQWVTQATHKGSHIATHIAKFGTFFFKAPPPVANVYRCRGGGGGGGGGNYKQSKKKISNLIEYHPRCATVGDTGHSQGFAHRHAYRQVWNDEFEFDGSPGIYNDFGMPSPHLAISTDVAQQPLSSLGDFLTHRVVPTWCDPSDRALVMAPIKKGYGLTNQLLSLAGQFALAGRTERIIAVDASEKKMRIPVHKLLNLSTSVLPATLRGVVRYCNHTAPHVMHKRMAPHSLQVIDRKQVALRPHKVMAIFDSAFAAVAAGQRPQLTYIHELYLRYPFEQERDVRYLPANLFCGFQFVSWIVKVGASVVRGVRTSRQLPYAAWHLRLETSDGVAMRKGRAPTTAQHVREFLEGSLVPLLQRKRGGITKVLLCSGPLPNAIVDAIRQCGLRFGIQFHQKEEFLEPGYEFNDFGTSGAVKERSGDHWTTPTATDAAAVDAFAMEKADLVVVTTTSSLSALIYAKRCGGHGSTTRIRHTSTFDNSKKNESKAALSEKASFPSLLVQPQPQQPQTPRTNLVLDARARGCSMNGAVYLYDTYLDGSFTELLHYPCGYQFHAYLPAPPALVPRPPPELDVFAFRFRPDSPLFRRHRERNRPPLGETPIPMEQP